MMDRRIRLCTLLAVSFAVSVWVGDFRVFAQSSPTLATIDGYQVSLEDFNIFFMKQLGAEGLLTFLQQIVVYREAKSLGLQPTPQEREEFIKHDMTPEIYEGFKELYSQAALDKFIEYNIMNRKYREYLENKFIKEKNIKVTDEDAGKFYYKNISKFQLAERVQLSIISVETEDKAKEVLSRLNKGEDFNQLASIYNVDEELRARGGYVGIIPKGGGLPQPIEDVAFSLTPGSYSQIIRGSLFHIIMVHKKLPAENRSLEDVREDIKRFLVEQKANEFINEHLQQLYKRELPRFVITAKLFKVGEEETSEK